MDIKRKRAKVELNIAPLIDIVFNLLLFFMLSYHISSNPGITVTLPQAKAAEIHKDELVVLFISKDNKIYVNQEEVKHENLNSILRDYFKGEDKKLIMKADEKINLGLAISVMDIAKECGVDNLVIATRQENDSK
ncbi:MAG: biopolymer transporter ExbD [Candidatus Omnitrophota bacterium]